MIICIFGIYSITGVHPLEVLQKMGRKITTSLYQVKVALPLSRQN